MIFVSKRVSVSTEPPQKVSISFVNLTGPMLEGRQYTLQCTVEHVAPVKDLRVTFYRGQTALGQPQSINSTGTKPVTQNFSVDISPGREEDGAQYWCEAKLELGPEGPKLPPVETSQNITATVHCESEQTTSTCRGTLPKCSHVTVLTFCNNSIKHQQISLIWRDHHIQIQSESGKENFYD